MNDQDFVNLDDEAVAQIEGGEMSQADKTAWRDLGYDLMAWVASWFS